MSAEVLWKAWKSYPHFLWITYEAISQVQTVEKLSTIIVDNSVEKCVEVNIIFCYKAD